MAQFDVYPGAAGKGYVLDCQSDLLSVLDNRVVIPLMPATGLPKATRLHPVFEIDGNTYLMSTHLLFAIPTSRLKQPVANLSKERDTIVSAIDVLWSGV